MLRLPALRTSVPLRDLRFAPSCRSDVGVIMGPEWDISVKSKDITTFVEVGLTRPALAVLPDTSLAKACICATFRLAMADRHQPALHQPSAMSTVAPPSCGTVAGTWAWPGHALQHPQTCCSAGVTIVQQGMLA